MDFVDTFVDVELLRVVPDLHRWAAGSSPPGCHRCSGWLWAPPGSPGDRRTWRPSPASLRRTGRQRASPAAAARSPALGTKHTRHQHACMVTRAHKHGPALCFRPAKITSSVTGERRRESSGLIGFCLYIADADLLFLCVWGLRCSNTAKIICSWYLCASQLRIPPTPSTSPTGC